MEFSMTNEKCKRFLDFTARLESVATTEREKQFIQEARQVFAGSAQLEGIFDRNMAEISRTKDPSMRTHNGPASKQMSQDEKNAYNSDVEARNKQWGKQLNGMKRRVKTAEHTLEEYAEIAPGELDAWVENTLRPTIEEYLDSEEGGLVWADESKKKVKRERGAGGFITPEMKRAKYDADKKKWIDDRNNEKKAAEEKKKAEAKQTEEANQKPDAKAEAKPEQNGNAPKKEEKKPGFWSKFKDAMKYDPTRPGRIAKKAWNFAKKALSDNVAEESIATSDLRACFESVFGNSDHLSDDAIRAICYNAVERKCR